MTPKIAVPSVCACVCVVAQQNVFRLEVTVNDVHGRKLAGLERYGFFILIFLLATGILGAILSPLIRVSQNVILTIFG